jgi:hypothetical protein
MRSISGAATGLLQVVDVIQEPEPEPRIMRCPGEGQRRNGEGEYLAFRLTDTASLEVSFGSARFAQSRDHPAPIPTDRDGKICRA